MEKYAAGTFGHVVAQLGLSWLDLAYVSRISPSTISRWAVACHQGRRVVLRCTEVQIDAVMAMINQRAATRTSAIQYTRSEFGLDLPTFRLSDDTATVVARHLGRINNHLAAISDPFDQYHQLVRFGREAKSDAERAAWDAAWRRYCRNEFPHLRNAYKTPPRLVPWYCPSSVLGGTNP